MKTLKIGITGISFLMLAVIALPCVAFGSQKSIPEKNNTGTTQENNTEATQRQNQGEEHEIQNQVIEQTEAGQDNNGSNNSSGKNEAEIEAGAKQEKSQNETESGMQQTTGKDNENSLEGGQKAQNQINQNQESHENQGGQGEQRRSHVASAVQEMLGIAERNPDIGQQMRVIAQNQNQEQEEMEGALQAANKRSGIVKLFIGPNYKELKKVENRLENHKNRLEELKGLRAQLENSADAEVLTQQIQVMEQIGAELENEVSEGKKGVSLFGWLFRWFSK